MTDRDHPEGREAAGQEPDRRDPTGQNPAYDRWVWDVGGPGADAGGDPTAEQPAVGRPTAEQPATRPTDAAADARPAAAGAGAGLPPEGPPPGGPGPYAGEPWWELPPSVTGGAAADGGAPPRPRRNRAVVAVGLAAALLVAEAAGIGIGHSVWRSSPAAAPGVARPGGGGLFGGGIGDGDGPGFFQAPGGSTAPGGSSQAAGGPSDVSAIAAKISPAVVDVNVSFGYQQAQGAGTGIVLTSNGEILTNNHVIDGATRITATDVGNGRTYTASVVGYDPTKDVAVLQLKGASGLTTARTGDSSKVAVGQAVVAVGNAGGAGGTPSSAGGSVTALNQSITASDQLDGTSEQLSGLIQVNAGIQSGDSGGPLVDTAGRVIGMNTAASDQFSFESGSAQGFAVPINTALTVARQIESGHGTASVHVGPTAFLGVMLSSDTSGGRGRFFGGGGDDGFGGSGGGQAVPGAAVSGTVDGTPARQAGLAAGDVITALGGHSVDSATALSSLMLRHHPGDRVSITWTDTSGQSHTGTVQLASGPPQ